MSRINRKVEYSLMALQFISEKPLGQLASAKEVAEITGSPFDATARVMQILAQKGILKSEQGSRGGYLLVRDLATVSYHELMECILGPTAIVKCINDKHACEIDATCRIKAPLFKLNDRLVSFYKGISIKELLDTESSVPKSGESNSKIAQELR
ncbi:MAG: Rrf2 family transcriptional regulator [Bdellovibrionales bacterium]|nr:Rrf2 family transcriptional regulator [Bdellovibrionales bacterium]